jgi:hypothetical protein
MMSHLLPLLVEHQGRSSSIGFLSHASEWLSGDADEILRAPSTRVGHCFVAFAAVARVRVALDRPESAGAIDATMPVAASRSGCGAPGRSTRVAADGSRLGLRRGPAGRPLRSLFALVAALAVPAAHADDGIHVALVGGAGLPQGQAEGGVVGALVLRRSRRPLVSLTAVRVQHPRVSGRPGRAPSSDLEPLQRHHPDRRLAVQMGRPGLAGWLLDHSSFGWPSSAQASSGCSTTCSSSGILKPAAEE